jgi:hypothetical protein
MPQVALGLVVAAAEKREAAANGEPERIADWLEFRGGLLTASV